MMYNFNFSNNDIKSKWLWLLCFVLKVMLSDCVKWVSCKHAGLIGPLWKQTLNFKWHEAKDRLWDAELCPCSGTSQHDYIVDCVSNQKGVVLLVIFLSKLLSCPKRSKVHSMECSQGVHNRYLSNYTLPKVTVTVRAFQRLTVFQYTESGYNWVRVKHCKRLVMWMPGPQYQLFCCTLYWVTFCTNIDRVLQLQRFWSVGNFTKVH